MPFTLRTTSVPPLGVTTEIEQIVLVDLVPLAVTLGPGTGSACIVGEFIKGVHVPAEVFSGSELLSLYGGMVGPQGAPLISQDKETFAGFVQDGSGVGFEGNAIAQLKGKKFRRIVLRRIDTDARQVDGNPAAIKAHYQMSLTVAASDQQTGGPFGQLNKEVVVPAGTRFADALPPADTEVIALSQDVRLPKGTPLSGPNALLVSVSNTDLTDIGFTGATVFFVKGIDDTVAITTPLDYSAVSNPLPNSQTFIAPASVGVDTDTLAGSVFANSNGVFAALRDRYDSLYSAAIDSTIPGGEVQNDIIHIWSARHTAVIRAKIAQNAIDSSVYGRGRRSVISAAPAASTSAIDAAAAKTAIRALDTETPGRSDRKFVAGPFRKKFSDELNRNILVAADTDLVSTMAMLPEEYNPAIAINDQLTDVIELEDAFVVNPLSRQDYVAFKANGCCILRHDRSTGWQFQSGVTTVDPLVEPARVPIKRRNMADFIQDTLANIGSKYKSVPATTERVDALVSEVSAFLSSLVSRNNPPQQRIVGFKLDPNSANTPALLGLGIFTLIVKVRLLASLDYIVFQTTIGETTDLDE